MSENKTTLRSLVLIKTWFYKLAYFKGTVHNRGLSVAISGWNIQQAG